MSYNNAKVYKVVNDIDDQIYVGSTKNTLRQRLGAHKSAAKNQRGGQLIYSHMNKLGAEHFYIVLVEAVNCDSRDELRAREEHWRKELKASLNMFRAIITPEEVKQDHKQYNLEHNERILAQKKQYREEQKEMIIEGRKRFRAQNRDKLNENDRLYREANKERVSETKKQWYAANKEKASQTKKAYYEANKEAILADQKEKHRLKVLAMNKPPKVKKTAEETRAYKLAWYHAKRLKNTQEQPQDDVVANE
jgi:hypothetical protein